VSSSSLLTGLERNSSVPVADLVERGDHHDGDGAGGGVGLDLPADLEAAHAGHHHVEQDEIGLDLIELRDRLLAVGRGVDLTGQRFEVGLEQLEVLGVIVDNEDDRVVEKCFFLGGGGLGVGVGHGRGLQRVDRGTAAG